MAIAWLRYRRPPATGVADTSRGHRPLHHQQPGQLAPPRAAHRRTAGSGARLRSRRGRRARAALPAGVHPPVARPHAAGRPGPDRPPHPPGGQRPAACSTAPGRGRSPGVARFFTTSFPAAVWHARRFVRRAARCSCSCPRVLMGVWLAAVGRRPRGLGPRRAARGLRGGRLRGVLLVGAGGASSPPQVTVNNIQVGLPRVRLRHPRCASSTAFILVNNGANVGQAAGLFAAVGRAVEVLRA